MWSFYVGVIGYTPYGYDNSDNSKYIYSKKMFEDVFVVTVGTRSEHILHHYIGNDLNPKVIIRKMKQAKEYILTESYLKSMKLSGMMILSVVSLL